MVVKTKMYGSKVHVQYAGLLTDTTISQEIYLNIIKSGNYKDIREEAYYKLIKLEITQEVYTDIAKNAKDKTIRKKALLKITDEVLLVEATKNYKKRRKRLITML